MTRETTRFACYKFFAQEETDRTVSIMLKLPGGLWITQLERTDDGLAGGDVIMDVAGEPASPQVLARRLRAARPGSTIPLNVRRSADHLTVQLPVRD